VQQKIQSVLIHGKALLFYVAQPYMELGMNLSVSTVVDALRYVDPRTEIVRFQFDGEISPIIITVRNEFNGKAQ
jgi:hypothetical protein